MDAFTVLVGISCFLLGMCITYLAERMLRVVAITTCGAILAMVCVHLYVYAQSHGLVAAARVFVADTMASIQWGNLTNIAWPKEL